MKLKFISMIFIVILLILSGKKIRGDVLNLLS